MFDQVFDSLRKATEQSVQLQQDMFKKWVSLWPALPSVPASWTGQVQDVHKKWAEAASEVLRRQQETMQKQFETGLENIEKAFQLCEAKSGEELRAKTVELWQKCFYSLRQAFEAQMRDYQVAVGKLVELTTKNAA